MNNTLKTGTLALAAFAVFAAPASARVEDTAMRFATRSVEPSHLLTLGAADLVREESEQDAPKLVRTAASRKTKRRLRASATVRINKKRMRRKPAARTTRVKTVTQVPASAQNSDCPCGSPVYDLPEDFAP